MRKNRLALSVIALLALVLGLAGCGGSSKASDDKDSSKTTITFWAAPNPPNLKYWQKMATDFEKENKDITVKVTQMKESPTSEATIQSAIASQTAPTLSENITRSFAAQLQESKAIVNFNKEDGFKDLIKGRKMTNTIKSWEFADGGQYVIPLSASPIMLAWRTDILKELGFDKAPTTYSEVYEVGKVLKAKYPDKFVFSNDGFVDPTAWMRWLDFIPFYSAASGGKDMIKGTKDVMDEKAVKNVFEFMSQLKKDNLVNIQTQEDAFETGKALAIFFSPSNLPGWEERFPELKYNDTYTVTNPTVPDSMKDEENVSTYGNAKGVVIYSQAPKKEQKAAMKFLDFVFGDSENDAQLLTITSSIPIRDDALTNDSFKKFYDQNPVFEPFGKGIPYNTAAMDNGKYNDIQTKMGEEGWIPAVKGQKDADKAWKDMSAAIKELLKDE